MKKYLVLGLFLCFGFAGLNAQAESTPQEPGDDIHSYTLRFLDDELDLTMNQLKVLKTFYGDNYTAMYTELKTVTDEAQRFVIENNYLIIRDQKIRALLTPEQLAIYEALTPPEEPTELSTLETAGGE
ncbi:hypothetical protein CEQ90_01880 [Lewinellaceae bacterium SD302]|nr:hypothetical protein CEQ90_01880 [Lewinellaceae bacterium SD302]